MDDQKHIKRKFLYYNFIYIYTMIGNLPFYATVSKHVCVKQSYRYPVRYTYILTFLWKNTYKLSIYDK